MVWVRLGHAGRVSDEIRYDWKGWRGDKWLTHREAMGAMLRPIDGPLIDALALQGPCRVADIGCGGGDTSRAVAARLGPGGEVHGVDLHPGLVEAARVPGGATFRVCNVEREPAPRPGYDRIVSRFGVMFFADAPAAFRRLREWLEPSGRLAFAVWGPLEDNAWISVVRDAVGTVVPLPEPKPDGPGPFRYQRPGHLCSVLEAAGFDGVQETEWCGSLAVGGGMDAEAAARFAVASFSSFAQLLEREGPAAIEAAQQELTRRVRPFERDGVVSLPARVLLVTAAR